MKRTSKDEETFPLSRLFLLFNRATSIGPVRVGLNIDGQALGTPVIKNERPTNFSSREKYVDIS